MAIAEQLHKSTNRMFVLRNYPLLDQRPDLNPFYQRCKVTVTDLWSVDENLGEVSIKIYIK